MTKGERTRKEIIRKAAVLFNQKGYAATSLQDLTRATGIQRGGLYNHFQSKEQLAEESFDYAEALLTRRLCLCLKERRHAVERLQALAGAFAELYLYEAPFPNGCFVLNTAVEAKQHLPMLREKAQAAMSRLRALVAETVQTGQACRELASHINPDAVASVFIATLEGALLLTVLHDEPVHLERAVAHLHDYARHLSA